MNVNLYLPDDLGERAKAAELPLSKMLRAAVETELYRIETIKKLENEMGEIELELENDNGDRYIGEITGVELAVDGRYSIITTDDDRVIVYDPQEFKHFEVDDPETDLRNYLDQDDYVVAMGLLGKKARIRI